MKLLSLLPCIFFSSTIVAEDHTGNETVLGITLLGQESEAIVRILTHDNIECTYLAQYSNQQIKGPRSSLNCNWELRNERLKHPNIRRFPQTSEQQRNLLMTKEN